MLLMNIRLPEEFSALQPETEAGGDWSVYLILCENGAFYCGISNRPQERFAAHLSGKGAKYTRLNKPVEMRIVSDGLNKSEALKREIGIKKLTAEQKRGLWAEAETLAKD